MTGAVRGLTRGSRNRNLQALLAEALFRSTGVKGVYGRSELYEDVVDRLSNWISRHRPPRH